MIDALLCSWCQLSHMPQSSHNCNSTLRKSTCSQLQPPKCRHSQPNTDAYVCAFFNRVLNDVVKLEQ